MVTIREESNNWGWYGATDQSTYHVYVDGRLWGSYCYLRVANQVADRIRAAESYAQALEVHGAETT